MSSKQTMRGIFERPPESGIWWISYCDAEGQRHREKVGRRSVALEAYVNRKREIREGRFVPPASARTSPKRISFQELAEQALAWKKNRTTLDTQYMDRSRLQILVDVGKLKGLSVSQVTNDRIAQALRLIREGGISGGAMNNYRYTLSSIFNYAVKILKILPANPVGTVDKFKQNEHRIRFLDADEEQALRAAIRKLYPIDGETYLAEIDLALNTGIRLGEQFSLSWQNVDLERGILTVHGKTGRRFVPVNSIARAALLVLHAGSKGASFVTYPSRRASSLTHDRKERDNRKWFNKVLQAAGVENFHWHDLRHTFASRLVMRGIHLRRVQDLLGHASIVQTMQYSHLAPGDSLAAVECLVPKIAAVSGTTSGTGEILQITEAAQAK